MLFRSISLSLANNNRPPWASTADVSHQSVVASVVSKQVMNPSDLIWAVALIGRRVGTSLAVRHCAKVRQDSAASSQVRIENMGGGVKNVVQDNGHTRFVLVGGTILLCLK